MPEKRFDQLLISLLVGGLLIALSMNLAALNNNQKIANEQALHVSLQQAQHYLLHYVKQQQQFPCADGNGDGYSDVIDDSATTDSTQLRCQYRLGWLPEVTLQHQGLRDETGQRFWYAVAENDAKLLLINGEAIALAVLISSGPALNWQVSRREAIADRYDLPLQPELYLEGINAQQPWQQFDTLGSIDSNDRLIWISASEWPKNL